MFENNDKTDNKIIIYAIIGAAVLGLAWFVLSFETNPQISEVRTPVELQVK